MICRNLTPIQTNSARRQSGTLAFRQNEVHLSLSSGYLVFFFIKILSVICLSNFSGFIKIGSNTFLEALNVFFYQTVYFVYTLKEKILK